MTNVLRRVDLAVGLLLVAYGVSLVSGLGIGTPEHAGAAAAVLVLLMTLPVAWRRQAPVAVAAVLAVGAVLNPLVIGDMIRCGPALPALLLVRLRHRPLARTGYAARHGIAARLACCSRPPCNASPIPTSTCRPWWPWHRLILGLYGVGRLVRSRIRLAAELEAAKRGAPDPREREPS